jgi:alanine racemase
VTSREPPPASLLKSELRIDLGAVAANYRLLAGMAAGAETAAMLKANAYGIGLVHAGRTLEAAGCRTFFTATVDEGIAARAALPDRDIYILSGFAAELADVFRTHRLRPVLNSLVQIREWQAAGGGPAALHIDTGINRLGLEEEEMAALLADPSLLGFDVTIIMSHLACADTPDHALNKVQLQRFRERTAKLKTLPRCQGAKLSLANSAGILLGTDYHFDLVRPGLALYGGNPIPSRVNPVVGVFSLYGRILQVRRVAQGECVGYGATFTAGTGCRVAVVDVGYADGYLRAFGNKGSAVVRGQRVAVVGRVSMDMITLDVTGLDDARPGDPALLLGGEITLEEAAKVSGLTSYELLTLLGDRYNRVYSA